MANKTKQKLVKMKIRKGDLIEVMSGNDIGRRGQVLRVEPDTNRVVVEHVNVHTKHQLETKTSSNRTMGSGIIRFEAPFHASNVMIVCPECDKPTRIGYRIEGGQKVRVCRKCDGELD